MRPDSTQRRHPGALFGRIFDAQSRSRLNRGAPGNLRSRLPLLLDIIAKFKPRIGSLSLEEQPLAHLIEVAAAARRDRVAIRLVRALKSVNSPAQPTMKEIATSDAADAACWIADTALAKRRSRPDS